MFGWFSDHHLVLFSVEVLFQHGRRAVLCWLQPVPMGPSHGKLNTVLSLLTACACVRVCEHSNALLGNFVCNEVLVCCP